MDLVDKVNIGKGCLLGENYRMIDILNQGNFGLVTKCVNVETRKMEAIKLIDKSNPDLFCQATNEITILWRLQHLDPYICNIVKMNDVFSLKDCVCIAFELLDQDLLDYVGDRQGGLLMSEIRPIIHQLATALDHLSSVGIIHADIKPENVMLVDRSQQPLKVKLIDFGLAFPVHGQPCAVVQTVGYRAPEVMLEIPFNEAIDMWSLGVTAAELAAGFRPYAGDKHYDVLSLIIKDQGQPSDDLLDCGKRTSCYFNRQTTGKLRWRFKTPQEFKSGLGCGQKTNGYSLNMLPKLMDHGEPSDQHLLLHLIKKMLQLDAEDRIKPLEVLQHPFFTYSLPQSPWNKASGPENIPGRLENTNDNLNYLLKHNITKGSLLGECHLLVDNLGEGGFGFVTRCFNIEKCKMEAVKVLKRNPDLLYQARNELNILKRLRCLNPDTCNVVKMNDVFFHKDYICLALELLDQDLLDYVGDRQGGLLMSEIRPIIHQLATALDHLSSVGIIHADIKPENVMLVDRSQQPLKVKLIDFGLAFPVHGQPCAVVQTVGYRAPEVMLEIPFNEAIDMWSLGVTTAELAIGDYLYYGDKDYDVLSLIIKDQGQPSDDLLDCGKRTSCYFNRQTNGKQRWRFKTPQEFKNGLGCGQKTNGYSLNMLPKLMDHGEPSDQHLLLHLIKKMLQMDAEDRIKPLEVLQHPFFTPIRQSPPVVSSSQTGPDSETPEVSPQTCFSIKDPPSEPEPAPCTGESATVSMAAGLEENVSGAQSDTSVEENDGYFSCLTKWIRDTYNYFCPCVGSKHSSWYQAAGPQDVTRRVESAIAILAAGSEQEHKRPVTRNQIRKVSYANNNNNNDNNTLK